MSVSFVPSRTEAGARFLRRALLVLAGSGVTALSAHIAVPFWPVPLTLQTLAVLGLGAVLGPRLGAAAVMAWIAEGVAGLPVFAGGLGPATLLGPTGGYMAGFVLAAALTGLAGSRGLLRRPLTALLAFVAADAAIFACGVAWLAGLIGWEKAVAGGLTPFLLGEGLKIALATVGALVITDRRDA